jgi:hypothetical protein
MPRPKSAPNKPKKRFDVGARVLISLPGVAGFVTQLDDEPSVLGEYMHTIETEHGERRELGCSLELIPKAATNVESRMFGPTSANIHIEHMENSAFVQGRPGASVNQTFNISSQEFKTFVQNLRELIADANLTDVQQSEADAEFSKLDDELKSPTPNRGIVRGSLQSLRTILENATGSLIGSAAYSALVHYILHLKP